MIEKKPFKRLKGNQVKIVQRKRVKNSSIVNDIVNSVLPSNEDPNGSYTGIPLNENEVPVQDADDL